MPSVKVLEEKKALVADLTEKIKGSASGVVVNYQGITVADDTALRVALRKANVEYKVYKNSITKRACENAGYGELANVFEGMTAIAVSNDDAVAPAKILKEYADKIESFKIKAGFIDNGVINEAEVITLAETPSKEVLIARLLGSIQGPLYNLAYGLQAIIDKSGEAVPAEEAPAEA